MRATKTWLMAAAIGLASGTAAAQTYPSRTVVFVVPGVPGPAPDTAARILADVLSTEIGPIVVENRPGAALNIGADHVRKAAPDGHTLLVGTNIYAFNRALGPLPFDVIEDFAHIGTVSIAPFYLAVNVEHLPVRSVPEFLAAVRAKPGAFAYATPGSGAPHHIGMELLKLQAKLDVTHVPYKSMGSAVIDLVAGRVHMTITGFPPLAAQMQSGKLRLIAVAGAGRSIFHPDVPTFVEHGFKDIVFESWVGMFAPKGTPPAIVQRWNAALAKALALPTVRERLAKAGMEPLPGTPDAMVKSLRDDIARYTEVVRAAGIKRE